MGQTEPMNTKRFFLMAVLAAGVVMSGMAANYPINNGVLQSALNANNQSVTNAATLSATNLTAQSIQLGGVLVTNWNQVGNTNGGGTATNLDAGATNQTKTLALQVALPATVWNTFTSGVSGMINLSGYLPAPTYNLAWGALSTNVLSLYLPATAYNNAWGNLSTNIFSGYLGTAAYNGGWGGLPTNVLSLYPLATTVVLNGQSNATLNNQTNTGTLYAASITPSVQSGGNLNINLGSGQLSGSSVSVGALSGNGNNITGIQVANITGLGNGATADTNNVIAATLQQATALLTTPTVVTQIITSIAYPNYGLRYEESGQGLGFLLFQQ